MLRTVLIIAALLVSGCALDPSELQSRSEVQAQLQPTGHRVEVNGMQMYYEVSGEGEPLVVLHGAYMNIPSMGAIIPKLAETHKVYALEFQGHGRTTDIDRPITYPNLADDVAAFMDEVGLAQADVFGYSMGPSPDCSSRSGIRTRCASSSRRPSPTIFAGGSRRSRPSSRR